MRISKWEYDQESKEEAERCARARCRGRVNLNIKGCVQQTISYMKTDLCNQIRDAGKMSAHRTNITKSRPLEESRKSNGKYKKLKKGEYTVTQWTKNMSEIAELETEEEADFIQDNVEFIGMPDGVTKYKSKISKDANYTFKKPGVYLYQCTPHKAMGMIGIVVVDNDKSNLDKIKKQIRKEVSDILFDIWVKRSSWGGK